MSPDQKNKLDKVRVDKWLWSVRIFKSRSLATDVCKKGRVKVGEEVVKPSFLVTAGDTIHVRKEGYNLTFEVTGLIEKRVSATLAQECYINHTPEEELRKYDDWFIGKAPAEIRPRGSGRPTKRERRELDEFKDTEDQ